MDGNVLFFCVNVKWRILVVKQKGDTMSVLTNVTLVDIIMKQILPSSQHLLTPNEVANAIETHLQTQEENIWPSWIVRQTYHDFMFFFV